MKTIINGRLIVPNEQGNFQIVTGKSLTFGDKIILIGATPADTEIIDAAGAFVAPGFINIHIHGAAGVDTMDDDSTALQTFADFLPTTGVTSFLPTTMTMPLEKIYRALERIRHGKNFSHGARILGAHLEGPFISEKFNGAQDAKNILLANFDLIKNFTDVIKIITVAPEEIMRNAQCVMRNEIAIRNAQCVMRNDNSMRNEKTSPFEFIARCCEKNIVVSIGHSAATYDIALAAINHGASHVTHLFNAQTGLHHRKPGIVGAALDSPVTVELIADNVHVHPTAQRIVAKCKPRSEIILITDSFRACGVGEGVSELGGQKVFVNGDIATLEDGTLAGSVAPMNHVLRNFCVNTGFDVAACVELVTKNPAVELKIYDELGSLTVGKAADITIFDDNFNVIQTFVRGQDNAK